MLVGALSPHVIALVWYNGMFSAADGVPVVWYPRQLVETAIIFKATDVTADVAGQYGCGQSLQDHSLKNRNYDIRGTPYATIPSTPT